jgi:hypothetical protein
VKLISGGFLTLFFFRCIDLHGILIMLCIRGELWVSKKKVEHSTGIAR